MGKMYMGLLKHIRIGIPGQARDDVERARDDVAEVSVRSSG